jgi:hypothetical protein
MYKIIKRKVNNSDYANPHTLDTIKKKKASGKMGKMAKGY